MTKRGGDELGYPLGMRNRTRPLRDRPQDAHLIDGLQRELVVVGERTAAANQHHRDRIHEGVGDAGHRISHSRTRGDDRDARATGGAGPSIGHVRCGLLVAGVDYAEVVTRRRRINRIEMPAVEGEDFTHALAFERAYKHFAAVDLCHERDLSSESDGANCTAVPCESAKEKRGCRSSGTTDPIKEWLELFGFPRRNLKRRDERALGIGQQVHELHFGEITYNLYRRESRVVDPDTPEMLQLRTNQMTEHRANDVAMRHEQDALIGIRLDGTLHRAHAALLHLRDRLATRSGPGQRMLAVSHVLGIVDEILEHHPFPAAVVHFLEVRVLENRGDAHALRDDL